MAIKVLMRLIVLVSLIVASVTVSAGTPFFDLPDGGAFFGFSNQDTAGDHYGDGIGSQVQGQLTAIPLQFIKNAGQTEDAVKYMIISDGASIFFTPDGLTFKLASGGKDAAVTHRAGYQFSGANPAPEIKGLDPGDGNVNFLVGDDPSQWITGIPVYHSIEYKGLYPGIDLTFEGTTDGLKSTYIVAPGASPSSIVLEYSGTGEMTIGADGALHVATTAGEIIESPPVCYQETDDGIVAIRSSYALLGNNQVGFSVGPYDNALPLIIDPVMKYGVYLRGIGLAYGRAIATDHAGNAYVTGESFPAPYSRAEGSFGESGKGTDVVVVKINAEGTAPVYVTYIGGTRDEMGKGIAVDAAGYAYITGQTDSPDFPLANPFQDTLGGGDDAFVTKLSPDGSTLVFSTYVGVPRDDSGNAIALDSAGNIYLTGSTWSSDFPAKGFTHRTPFGGTQDAFILKMSNNGSQIFFSEFLGGSLVDAGNGVAVDSAGNSYITGVTSSRNFPVKNAIQPTLAGKKLTDAFVTKVSATGDTIVYSTYLGGSLSESGHGIAVDSQGRAHVTGNTLSKDFPTKDPFQAEENGCYDAFYTRLSPDGSVMQYSTYLGGINNDEGNGVAIDACDNVYITGFTQSYDFPVIDPYQSKFAGTNDAFIVKFVPRSTTPDYSTFVGGNGKSVGAAVAIHQGTCVGCTVEMTCVYVTGYTDSSNFPSSDPYPVAFEPAGGRGGFVFVLCDPSDCPGPVNPPIANFTYHFECPNPLYVQFTDTSLNNPTSWFWQFGDGTTSNLQNPTHTYTAYGGYNVTLTVSNAGGSSSATRIFCITECPGPVDPPIANFTYHFECPNPLYVQFTDTSLKNPTSWYWSFGDGTTSNLQNPTHTYTAYGGYNVTLTVSNAGGSSSATRIFCITECPGPVNPPVANFNYLSQCPNPLNVQFTDTSTGYPTSWSWSFGDGTTSTDRNPTHTYSAPSDYSVTLTATNSAGSNSVTKTIHITECPGPVNPPVANFNYLSQCPNSLNVQFTDTSTNTPTSWSWSFGDETTSTLQNPTHTYSSTGDYSVTLTATNSAGSNSVTKTVHVPECPGPVNPPVANFNYLSQCPNPLNVQFTDTSTGNPTSWYWSFGDEDFSSLQNPSHTYFSYGNYQVTLTVTNEYGSSTTSRTLHIEPCTGPVNPPVANFNYLSQCPNSLNVQFTDTSTNTPTSWSWSFGDETTSTLQNPTHTYSSTGDYSVTLTATNSAGSNSVTKTVHVPECPGPVNPPVANFNYLSQCPNSLNVQFTDTSTNTPTSWSWSFGDETTSTLQNPTHTYSSTGDYSVTLTATNSAGSNSVTKTVHVPECPGPVNPPVANFNYLSQCPNSLNVQFTDTSTNTPTSWSWSFGDETTSTLQNPTHTYSSTGDYSVTLTATNSAGSNSVTKTVHVPECPGPGNPPVADFTYIAQCPNPLYAQFTDTSTGNPTSWHWSFGDGTTSTERNPTHTYPGVGGYEITLTVSNAYGSSSKSKVLCISCITCPPVANFTFVSQCPNPLYVQFTDTSSKIATEGPTSWSWQFGDGTTSTLQNPTHTYATISDYTVTLTAYNSAGSNTISKTVHLTPCTPAANFTYLSQCPNSLNVQFTDTTSAIITEKPTAWFWQFGDGTTSTLQNPAHTYAAVTDYNVTLTASNSAGSSTISKIVHITPCPPQANFTVIAKCPNPLYAEFTDTSTGNPTSWFWQFGDGTTSTLQNPTHTYAAVGGYEITLTVSNAGGSSSISKILCISCITCPPVANFTFISQCPNPLNVQFTDTSSTIVTEKPTAWSWTFGDGTTSTLQNPTHTYSALGDYNVTLTASNAGGSSSVSKIVHIAPCSPAADFTFVTQCPNPLNVQFTDTSSTIVTEKPTAWSWTFGDGTTSTLQNPTHTYSALGDYNVTLTASNAGGSSSVSKTVHIAPCPPVVNFNFVTQCPNPLNVQFTDTSSTIITEKPTAWFWQFGDGTTSALQNPTHTYSALGDYNVTLTASNAGGSSSVSKTVHIAPCPPVVNFNFITQCPNPLNVQFTDTSSTIITEKPTAWSWTFGDGTTSTLQNPTHTYSALGDYNVTLTASNAGGSSTVSKTVHIAPCPPVVNFNFVTQCPNPLNVQFTDTSSTIVTEKPTAWSWTFGDGTTSTLQNPSHTYSALGDYNVTLTASNAGGSSSVSKTVHIAPCSPAADFTFVTQCPNPLNVQFTDTSSTIVTEKPTAWSWTFGDGTTSTLQNPTHTYSALGDYNVTLTASNAGGSSSVSKTVHIAPCPPVVNFNFITQCPNPLNVQFTDTSSTIITEKPTAWFWQFGDGTTSALQNPTHTYSALGDYNVTLTASNAAGSSTVSKTVHIAPCPPVVNFEWVSECPNPLDVQFTDTSSTIITERPTSWSWNFGDGATSTFQNPAHTYAAYGDYNVTLTASNAAGSRSISKTVHITVCPDPPIACFWTYPQSGTAPLEVEFCDCSKTDILTWFWDFGDGNTSTLSQPTHIYYQPGSYTVSLTVTNATGTDTEVQPDYIQVTSPPPSPPRAYFTTNHAIGPVPLTIVFTDLSSGIPDSWLWNFGDGATSTERNPTHVYTQPGYYTVSLEVKNSKGSSTYTTAPGYIKALSG